jgi:hypothetical protein
MQHAAKSLKWDSKSAGPCGHGGSPPSRHHRINNLLIYFSPATLSMRPELGIVGHLLPDICRYKPECQAHSIWRNPCTITDWCLNGRSAMSTKNLLSFPSGIVPMLPAIGDKVHWVALNSENLPAVCESEVSATAAMNHPAVLRRGSSFKNA